MKLINIFIVIMLLIGASSAFTITKSTNFTVTSSQSGPFLVGNATANQTGTLPDAALTNFAGKEISFTVKTNPGSYWFRLVGTGGDHVGGADVYATTDYPANVVVQSDGANWTVKEPAGGIWYKDGVIDNSSWYPSQTFPTNLAFGDHDITEVDAIYSNNLYLNNSVKYSDGTRYLAQGDKIVKIYTVDDDLDGNADWLQVKASNDTILFGTSASADAAPILNTTFSDTGISVFEIDGNFFLDSPIVINRSNFIIRGNMASTYGASATNFVARSVMEQVILVNPNVTQNVYSFAFKDITIIGNALATDGLVVNFGTQSTYENIRVLTCTGDGLRLAGCQKIDARKIRVEQCGTGLNLTKEVKFMNNCNILLFESCTFTDNQIGQKISNLGATPTTMQATFIRTTVEGNHQNGTVIDTAHGIGFYDCHWETNDVDNSSGSCDFYAHETRDINIVNSLLSLSTTSIVLNDCTRFHFNDIDVTGLVKIQGGGYTNTYFTIENCRFQSATTLTDCWYGTVASNSFSTFTALGGHDNILYNSNKFNGVVTIPPVYKNNTFMSNDGFVTESSGVSSVLSGQTYKDVAHNLSITPTAQQITITPKEDFHYRWPFVDNINATHFRVNLMNGTAPEDLDFGWSID